MYTIANDVVVYTITRDNAGHYDICTKGPMSVYNHYNVPECNLFSSMVVIAYSVNNNENRGCGFEVEM